MLAETRPELPPEGALPGGLVMEAKSDGFRALLFARPDGALVQSRQGADLTRAFPDIAAVAAGLDLVLDGELVVPAHGRLDFGELHRRARRRGRRRGSRVSDRLRRPGGRRHRAAGPPLPAPPGGP
ncbi:hypothetical protein ABT382_31365, partial [Streptomyces pharetrae]